MLRMLKKLLRLLDLHGDPAHESTIRIPVVMGVRDGKFDGLAIQTRSVAAIMSSAAAAIDVQREHVEEGIVNATAEPSALLTELDASLRIYQAEAHRSGRTLRCSIAAGGTTWMIPT